MNQQIDKTMVERVAHLSRLELSEQELSLFSSQLGAIVGYIQKLDELDVAGIEPLAHCLPVHNVFREDTVKPSLTTEQALQNAPDRQDDYFKVPQILDDNSAA